MRKSLSVVGISSIASPHGHVLPDLSQAMLADALDSEQIVHGTIGSASDDALGEGRADPWQHLKLPLARPAHVDPSSPSPSLASPKPASAALFIPDRRPPHDL